MMAMRREAEELLKFSPVVSKGLCSIPLTPVQ